MTRLPIGSDSKNFSQNGEHKILFSQNLFRNLQRDWPSFGDWNRGMVRM